MDVSIEDLKNVYEEIQPLNFGRRLVFQSYCSLLVREKRIRESDVEEFLTTEFLFEKKVSKLRKIITLIANVGTVYVAYKLIRGLI